MVGSMWATLLQRIPPARHEILVVVTAAGVELMVKKIVRLDDDFVILRGRLAGSSDQNRVVMLPYDHIDNVAFAVLLPDDEIHAIFGDSTEPAADAAIAEAPAAPSLEEAAPEPPADAPVADQAPAELTAPPPRRDQTPGPASAAEPAAAAAPPKLSKSVLLARLRARLSSEPVRGP